MLDKPQAPPRLSTSARPILKWAGGKAQLLDHLHSRMPARFEKYFEPFFGGGALFFSVTPERAIISDSNPELINMYVQVASNLEEVVGFLLFWRNTEEEFYRIREWTWQSLSPAEAAARTIFLNKTCFNGLYRVNRRGQFNVPYGRYSNPRILDVPALKAAATVLQNAQIRCADFREALKDASAGDFVFLDPPYVPVSKFADFKRYTKEQFSLEDHRDLAREVDRLVGLGCHVVLTNSDDPFVMELYSEQKLTVVPTRRHISSKASTRRGTDLIVEANPVVPATLKDTKPFEASTQVSHFPSTRYMGSKAKLLGAIRMAAARFDYDTAVDLFSGSGVVSYMFKAEGKRVIANDHMAMAHVAARALVANSATVLASEIVNTLLRPNGKVDDFVRRTFSGLYYRAEDEFTIDVLRTNIRSLPDGAERDIALAALVRACIKKRPRGIFTYTGHRYDDGRKDLKLTIAEHFIEAVNVINAAVFANGHENLAHRADALEIDIPAGALVYIDPPYWSPLSDNEYVRRYHFVEGLARDWQGVEIQGHTATRKFKAYPTPFRSRHGAATAFDNLLAKCTGPIIISYSSNSEPTKDEMIRLIRRHKKKVDVIEVAHRYSFGTQGHLNGSAQNAVSEYLFLGV